MFTVTSPWQRHACSQISIYWVGLDYSPEPLEVKNLKSSESEDPSNDFPKPANFFRDGIIGRIT